MPPCGLRGLGGRFGELRILNLPIVLHFLDSDCELKFLLSRTELEFQAMRVFDSINREELSQSNNFMFIVVNQPSQICKIEKHEPLLFLRKRYNPHRGAQMRVVCSSAVVLQTASGSKVLL